MCGIEYIKLLFILESFRAHLGCTLLYKASSVSVPNLNYSSLGVHEGGSLV